MITFYVFYLKSIFYDVQITGVIALRSNRGPFVNICKIHTCILFVFGSVDFGKGENLKKEKPAHNNVYDGHAQQKLVTPHILTVVPNFRVNDYQK